MLSTFQIHTNLPLIGSILALVDLLTELKDLLLSKQNDGGKRPWFLGVEMVTTFCYQALGDMMLTDLAF